MIEKFRTEVYGLFVKLDSRQPTKIGFCFRTPQGKETTRWVVDAVLAKKIAKWVKPHVDNRNEDAKLTAGQIDNATECRVWIDNAMFLAVCF